MRKIIYIFIFAILLLVLKAFVLDEYIARYYNKDTNTTVAESNTTSEETDVPELKTLESTTEPVHASEELNQIETNREKNITTEQQKMPLEQLGDEFSKHIKL